MIKLFHTLRIALVAAGLGLTVQAFAQQTITGKVIDQAGEPVAGAVVIIDGTSNGVITNLDGEYAINAAQGARATINVLGFKDASIVLAPGQTTTLETDTTLLEEVVVVGYGTARKETLSGAIAVVKDEMLQDKGSLASPLQALQGQVPGVIITRSSSAPGDEGFSMSLRGSVSTNSSEPLVIIDGVACNSVSDMRLLNPSDIESMSFLKDGSAAIYGSRAAGGVVLITTKKGNSGKAKVEYNGSVSAKFVGLMPTLMTLDEWSDSVMSALENDGNTGNVWYSYAQLAKQYKGTYIDLQTDPNPFGTTGFTDVSDFVFDDSVDWLSDLFRTALSTSHDLSVSGGNDTSSYRLSLGYMYDGSTLRYGNNNNQRYSFRLNNSVKLSDKVNLDSVASYNRQEQVAPTNVSSMLPTIITMPGLPMFSKDGKAYAWGTWTSPASIAEEGGDNHLSVNAFNLSETLTAKMADWLTGTVNIGYNHSTAVRNITNEQVSYYNYAGDKVTLTTPTDENTYFRHTDSVTDFFSGTAYLNARKKFGGHNTSLTAGAQYEFKSYSYSGTEAYNIQQGIDIINGSGEIKLYEPEAYQYAMASFFGRANYDFGSKYLLEANARFDGSSKFLPKNRWAFFWGASGAWRIAQEDFLKDVDWISELKLRASYGEVGNQNGIPYYDGVQLYNISSSSGALIGDSLASLITTTGTFASSARTWERIKNYNAGLDFGFFDGRLMASVETFLKRNDNMLVSTELPSTLGDNAPKVNQGKFKAWGYEGQIQWRNAVSKDFSYNIGGTFTFARNELVDYGGTVTVKNGYVSNREGYPLNSLFGLRYAGKIQTEEQRQAYLDKYYEGNGISMPNNLRLGDNMFEDANKDGILDENDYVYLGTDTPEIQYSINAGVNYKGFDFSIILQGAANRTMWNGYNNWTCPMRALYTNTTNQSVGNTWSTTNTDAYYPALTNQSAINTYNYQASSWSASDGSYLRLKDVSLGYTLPDRLIGGTPLSGVRVYATGTDLWEISNIIDGWDPEAKSSPSGTGRYPFTRGLVFGVNIKF